MDRFRSLTARLVLTAVALVALVCLLIAGATTLAMRAYLNGRLDDEVREAVARTLTDRPGPGDEPGRFTAVGSLRANFPEGTVRPTATSSRPRATSHLTARISAATSSPRSTRSRPTASARRRRPRPR